ncbi:transketolase [Candidatus Micrarchaeota archaeon]|nr:transketolase [Candidatus Micrarchaeota archaeon]
MELEERAKNVRRRIIEMVSKSKSSHVGAALSIADIVAALYFSALRRTTVQAQERDRFILSKGHACAALYAALAEAGCISQEELDGFYIDGGKLPGHATLSCGAGVEASTGSLGHGLPIAAGIALSARIDKKGFRTFALLGDGECDEGSVWEAAMFAGNAKLDNLIAIVDYNKLQAFGYTKEVLDLEPLAKKWEAFGWAAREIDGHDLKALDSALNSVPFEKGKPSVIIAHTTKGKGVSFMEGRIEWHYKSPDPEQRRRALEELQ